MQTNRVIKILIMGLPGSGKTTLAEALSKELSAIHLNADEMRNNVWTDLTFEYKDRLTQSKRMSALSDLLNKQGHSTIADFVCPTEETRMVFGKAFIIFVDRIEYSKYEDTNKLFERPTNCNVHIQYGLTLDEQLTMIKEKICHILQK
jgi:adenylylsulfate kinase